MKLQTIHCFWCKRLLWGHGFRLEKHCSCVGYGRHRFHARLRARSVVHRARRCFGQESGMTGANAATRGCK